MIRMLLFTLLACLTTSANAQSYSSATLGLYGQWLAKEGNAARVRDFERDLAKRGLNDVLPTHQILRTARDWRECGDPFALPDRASWSGMFATLALVKNEIVPLVGKIEAVSGYRDPAMNACAGGATTSAHMQFGALDFYAMDSGMSESRLAALLCHWQSNKPARQAIGLGFYGNRKFHIDADVKWARTWGPGGRSANSPCRNAG